MELNMRNKSAFLLLFAISILLIFSSLSLLAAEEEMDYYCWVDPTCPHKRLCTGEEASKVGCIVECYTNNVIVGWAICED